MGNRKSTTKNSSQTSSIPTPAPDEAVKPAPTAPTHSASARSVWDTPLPAHIARDDDILVVGYIRQSVGQLEAPSEVIALCYKFWWLPCDEWDDTKLHDKMRIIDKHCVCSDEDFDHNMTAIGTHSVTQGRYVWSIRIKQAASYSPGSGYISQLNVGVIKDDEEVLSSTSSREDCVWSLRRRGYLLCSGSHMMVGTLLPGSVIPEYSDCNNVILAPGGTGRGNAYGTQSFANTGDRLELTLDLESKTISYCINGEDQGIAFQNVEQSAYRFALGFVSAPNGQVVFL